MLRQWRERLKRWSPPAALDLARRLRTYGDRNSFELRPVRLSDLFPGIEATEISFPVSQMYRSSMALPFAELITIAAICRQTKPHRVFEIGTYTGSTTLLIAANTPPDTEILTLDLDSADLPEWLLGPNGALYKSGSCFHGTAYAGKIRQQFGRSQRFDFGPYAASFDLVFIDGDHSYSAVKQDTQRAQQLLCPGGIIIWDDYLCDPMIPTSCIGVAKWLSEFDKTSPCFHVAGTRLAIYQNSAR